MPTVTVLYHFHGDLNESEEIPNAYQVEDPVHQYIWYDIFRDSEIVPPFRDNTIVAKVINMQTAAVLKRKVTLKLKNFSALLKSPAIPNKEPKPTHKHESKVINTTEKLKMDSPVENENPKNILEFESSINQTPSNSIPTNNSQNAKPITPIYQETLYNRDELAAKREAEVDDKVEEALRNKREIEEKFLKESEAMDLAREKYEKSLQAWAMNNKEKRNIRSLLSTMHTVLWPGSNWKPIGLGDVLEPRQVKLQYRKAMLMVHPDKSANSEPEIKFIAKRMFEAINEAYEEFLKKEGV